MRSHRRALTLLTIIILLLMLPLHQYFFVQNCSQGPGSRSEPEPQPIPISAISGVQEPYHAVPLSKGHPVVWIFFPRNNFGVDDLGQNKERLLTVHKFEEEDEYWYLQAALMAAAKVANFTGKQCKILDLGANIGYITIVAASIGCQVECVEASPKNALFLRHNIEFNHFADRVKLHQGAISRSNKGHLNFATGLPGIYQHIGTHKVMKPGEVVKYIKVPILPPLGDIVQLDDIAFVKVDVEGFESDVVWSCEKLVRDKRAALMLFEWEPDRMRERSGAGSVAVFLETLISHGYVFHHWNGLPIDDYKRLHDMTMGDLWAVRSGYPVQMFFTEMSKISVSLGHQEIK